MPLAGCLGGGGEDATTPAGTTDAGADTEVEEASSPDADIVDPRPDELPPLESVATPFTWEGQVGRGACLPSGPGACTSPPVPLGESDQWTTVAGQPVAASLVLTWSAQTPLTEQLYFSLFAVRSCGNGCTEWSSDMFSVVASGPSPLTIDAPEIELAEDEQLALFVGEPNRCHSAAVVMGCLSVTEQPFKVEGTLTTLVPAVDA